ncbi:di-trans,poly-cis-decaprenylcistransferase [Sinimarinibacterium sp. CAU 1509]|uniref:polyprenyl diphosphate synthase n=1 Tax=Sinimarinibacterium sp. CAU 1509 TaxID=2562283 RepID=UPI0010AC0C53|nr:polyprenyl diphosphate synthase [Sinimarinibacterium sp. CAU 1509]TJY62085.1 di-trans,poly-cis-decaprenylcistransferase [Sinimarinibacterium sp. CAU 1509]
MSHQVPELTDTRVPRHVAIIMDGNGRWAVARGKPRSMGHRAGVRAVRKVIRAAAEAGVEVLTLFAFSQENWNRPDLEVRLLIELFKATLKREAKSLDKNDIRMRFIGDHRDFPAELREQMKSAEAQTASNAGMTLVVAVGYGGQWDIVQAAQRLAAEGRDINADSLADALDTRGLPDPELLIRTGGESRISNFLLWQLAYTELYFTPQLWPDFDGTALMQALDWYAGRQRRFGRVPEAA